MSEQNEGLSVQIIDVVRVVIARRQGDDVVQVPWIAKEVFNELDPGQLSPPMVAWSSILQLRQFARQELRRQHDIIAKAEDTLLDRQAELPAFDELQERYPIAEGEYKKRELLTLKERQLISARLGKAAAGLARHKDIFDAETADMYGRKPA